MKRCAVWYRYLEHPRGPGKSVEVSPCSGPGRVASIEELFQAIALGEEKGMGMARERISRGFFRTAGLVALSAGKWRLVYRADIMDEYQQIIQHVRVMLQWVGANITDELTDEEFPSSLPKKPAFNNFARSRYLAENIVHLMERDKQQAKVIIWPTIFMSASGLKIPSMVSCKHGALP